MTSMVSSQNSVSKTLSTLKVREKENPTQNALLIMGERELLSQFSPGHPDEVSSSQSQQASL